MLLGTRALAGESVVARPVDKIAVKGKLEGIVIYELMAITEDASEELKEKAGRFEAIFAKYLSGEFTQVQEELKSYLVDYPEDGPAKNLAERSVGLSQRPPAAWDGVTRLSKK